MLFPQPLVCNEIGFNLIAPVFCSGQVRLHAPERRTISLNPDFSAVRLYRIPVLPDHFRQAGDSQSILAPELVARILLTSLPWYLCGITGYLFAAWICLEPTWRRRIIDLLIAVGVVRIFFLSSVPEAYNCFLPWLVVYTAAAMLLPQLSVSRFKEGCQD